MQSTTKHNQRDYSPAFKLAVVEQVEKGINLQTSTIAPRNSGPYNGIRLSVKHDHTIGLEENLRLFN
ncbi:hypothetical protein GCM10027170_07230 [Aliiglaciecola aliphaticivorans]